MRLYQLAYACRLYGVLGGFDSSLVEFRRVTSPALDLGDQRHRKALLVWLNSWGCRQFAKDYHEMASRALVEWSERYLNRLPPMKTTLSELPEIALDAAAEAYGDLNERRASMQSRKSGSCAVTFGSTGAAKVLYALRPAVFPPWDDPIRKNLGHDGSADSYREFLRSVQKKIRDLEQEATQYGIGVEGIPAAVGRPESSLVKLVDEYYWVTITRGFTLPTREELRRWADWASYFPVQK